MNKSVARVMTAALAVLALAGDSWATYRWTAAKMDRVSAASAPASAPEEEDPIARFRTEREQLRARQTAQLNEIIHGSDAGGETALDAQRQLLNMMDAAGKELTLEGVLQARGFGDALVTVNDDSVNVLLRREAVTRQESAVILELVLRETGVTGGNVKIIPVN